MPKRHNQKQFKYHRKIRKQPIFTKSQRKEIGRKLKGFINKYKEINKNSKNKRKYRIKQKKKLILEIDKYLYSKKVINSYHKIRHKDIQNIFHTLFAKEIVNRVRGKVENHKHRKKVENLIEIFSKIYVSTYKEHITVNKEVQRIRKFPKEDRLLLYDLFRKTIKEEITPVLANIKKQIKTEDILDNAHASLIYFLDLLKI